MTDVLASRLRSNVGSRVSRAGGTGRPGRGSGGGELTPPGPSGLPVRRRWGRVAAGTGLIVVWVWGTVAVVRSAGHQREVVAVAADVERYEQIDRSDLRVARVS